MPMIDVDAMARASSEPTRPEKLRAYLERKRALIEYQLSGVIVGIPARTEMPGTPMTFAEEYALLGDLLRWMDEANLAR